MKRTPQDCINEVIIWNFNQLVLLKVQLLIDYSNIELPRLLQEYG